MMITPQKILILVMTRTKILSNVGATSKTPAITPGFILWWTWSDSNARAAYAVETMSRPG